jgi:hypothetical protein
MRFGDGMDGASVLVGMTAVRDYGDDGCGCRGDDGDGVLVTLWWSLL